MPMIQSFRPMKMDYYECTIGINYLASYVLEGIEKIFLIFCGDLFFELRGNQFCLKDNL